MTSKQRRLTIEQLERISKNLVSIGETVDYTEFAIEALEQEPKTGHWKRISMDKYSEHAKYWYRCDRCGKDNLGDTNYCPNCGAMMQEVEDNG